MTLKYSISSLTTIKWVTVFKNGPSKNCGKQFFKGYFPQILRGPFLNTLTQTTVIQILEYWMRITFCVSPYSKLRGKLFLPALLLLYRKVIK